MTSELTSTIRTRYDVDPLDCDALTVEWAASLVALTYTPELAARQWRTLNRARERLGRCTTIPTWSSPLFRAYFNLDNT